MRPSIAVAACVVLCHALVQPPSARAQVGVTAGFSSSSIPYSTPSGSQFDSHRSGFVGGASFLLPHRGRAGVEIDALVRQAGAKDLMRIGDEFRTTYFEVPVLLRLNLAKRAHGSAFIVAGPTMAFNVKATYVDEGVKVDVRDDIRKGDVGLTFGGGVDVGHLTFDTRYTWGLINVIHDAEAPPGLTNQALTASVGFRFGR